jgi:pyruvate/2-oxoglutarate dehydrogenase complex dihydrolipoamide acyltransferase (E2) component
LAVATPAGLLVPVVRDAQRLGLQELHEQLVSVIGRARDRTASAQELTGGTFTLTNFGSYGTHMGTPILMPPQVGILGIGAMLDRPVVRDGELAVGKVVHTCLTVDHRVIDGETAGIFQNELGRLLTDPELLLLG